MPRTSIVDSEYRRSSFCGEVACVEVAALPDGEIAVRDAKDTRPDAPVLRFTPQEWDAFLLGVHAGEFSVGAMRSA